MKLSLIPFLSLLILPTLGLAAEAQTPTFTVAQYEAYLGSATRSDPVFSSALAKLIAGAATVSVSTTLPGSTQRVTSLDKVLQVIMPAQSLQPNGQCFGLFSADVSDPHRQCYAAFGTLDPNGAIVRFIYDTSAQTLDPSAAVYWVTPDFQSPSGVLKDARGLKTVYFKGPFAAGMLAGCVPAKFYSTDYIAGITADQWMTLYSQFELSPCNFTPIPMDIYGGREPSAQFEFKFVAVDGKNYGLIYRVTDGQRESDVKVFIPNDQGSWGGDPCQLVSIPFKADISEDPQAHIRLALFLNDQGPQFGSDQRHLSPLGDGPGNIHDCRQDNPNYLP